ncbi:MAG: cellulase-like family protein [Puniceicoccaceae bacterium]
MKTYFDNDIPLTIAMWDFSWLQCNHPGGSFQDLAKCVQEAAERGYNTLRVDVFPHYYLKETHTFPQRGHGRRIRTWGDVLTPGGYTVNVRDKVIELANLCRKHDIWLGLDTWKSFEIYGHDYRIPPEEEESFCRNWADTWVNALRLMREDGILERAAWVAPLNEVPIFLGNLVRRIREDTIPQKEIGDGAIHHLNPHHDPIFMELNRWLGESIKAEIERDSIPLLYSGVWVENYPARVPEFYDAVDAHFMPDAQLTEADRVALEKAGKGASGFTHHQGMDHWNFALFSAAWERAVRRNYEAMLENARAFCEKTVETLSSPGGLCFELICTEAYGPCNHPDHEEVDWSWYKHYNADAARIFADYPFSGLTLSNHAEPLFSLWQDADWQARGTAYIRTKEFSGIQ